MSFFGKMFGGKKEEAPTTGEAIQKLRETENMLLKKQDFLENKIEAELDTARKNGTKNKRGRWSYGKLLLSILPFFKDEGNRWSGREFKETPANLY